MRLNIEKTAVLKNSIFFSKTPEESLLDLAEKSKTILLQSGETVVPAKSIPEAVFVVFNGQVELHENDGETKHLGKGDTIGFLETLEEKEADFFAVATEETEIIKIDKKDLLLEIESNPELASGIIKTLCYLISQK